MDIEFLTLDQILETHTDQIGRYGGSLGVRDPGLLQSAAAMPSATFGGEFLHADVYEMAAAYLFHIVQNHPFVDGNKRTGAAASLTFLLLNDAAVDVAEDELQSFVQDVAKGIIEKSEVSEFLRANSRQLK